MRRGLKILILSILIILVTGCSGNYNLTINGDLSIKEELDISIENKDIYQKTLNLFEENEISEDNYDVTITDDIVKINYVQNYSSIEDYIINSKLYHQIFGNINYNKTKDNIELSVDESLKLKNTYNSLNGTNLTDLDYIQVNITNPFKLISTNAELINDNTYTWSIRNTDIDKNINIKFKTVIGEFPYRAVIIGSVMLLVIIILVVRGLFKYRKMHRF